MCTDTSSISHPRKFILVWLRELKYLDRTRLSRDLIIWLPPPHPLYRHVSISLAGDIEKERQPADLGRVKGGGEAQSNDREKAWSSINHQYSLGLALGSSAAECTFVKVRKAELRLLTE